MVYEVKKYNGVTQASVAEGGIDRSTPIKFIGKNYIDYGLIQNENFLHITENFAGSTPPSPPVEGMLWYDDNLKVIKFYSESKWKTANSAIVSDTEPADAHDGGLWWDTQEEQLYVKSGNEWKLLGPLTEIIGDIAGNSDTASRLQTPRFISLTGAVTGATLFDGSANVLINTEIPSATSSNNGLMTSVDKTKLNGIEANAQRNVPTDLTNVATATQVRISSSTGIETVITSANTTNAGVMSAADKTKLNDIESGSQKNVPTNLSKNVFDSRIDVLSSTGTGVSIDSATTTTAGLMSATDKLMLSSFLPATSENVLNATASGGAGEIGTYALLSVDSPYSVVTGGVVSGSRLRYVGAVTSNYSGSAGPTMERGAHPPGTWRCMGYNSPIGGNRSENSTLFLRIY